MHFVMDKKRNIVFVSGIGTGVGKSVVAGLMARDARNRGVDAITVKMVQTGNSGYSEDLQLHRRLMGGILFEEDGAGLTAPQIFAFPSSADLAARLEGKRVDVEKIVSSVDACARNRELVIVESAGGLLVPLDGQTYAADVAAKEGWPLVLVTNCALGSINHTLLSLEAACARGMTIERVVCNWSPGVDPAIDEDTPKAIKAWLDARGIAAEVVRQGRVELLSREEAGKAAQDMLEYDREYVWHPYASLANPPPVRLAAGANGCEIVLADGRRLVDGVSSWWCQAHGYNHPAITAAIRAQSEKLCHVMFGGFTHAPAVELARKLGEMAPAGLDRVFFADSGSISVEVAVKMATQYQHAKKRPGRAKMLSLKGGYHGDTACAMALSDPDGMHTLFAGMMPRHFFADKPASPACFDSIREMAARHKDEIAGIICEPVLQAANAMNIYGPEYLRELRRIADEYDFVLVFDEIATGLHRLGPRWACELAGVAPDVMTVGKALTGGHMTLAATIASERVAATISNGTPSAFMHGPTYMANPLACAAALASLELFENGGYEAKTTEIARQLAERLEAARALPNVADVRTIGAVGIIETKALPARGDIERVIDSHGVWLRPFSNFIYTMPPLVSSQREIARICDAMLDLASAPPGSAPAPGEGDFHE